MIDGELFRWVLLVCLMLAIVFEEYWIMFWTRWLYG